MSYKQIISKLTLKPYFKSEKPKKGTKQKELRDIILKE